MDFEKDYLDNETSDENIEDLNKDEPFDEKELELEPEKEEPEEQSKGGTKSANDPEPVYFEKFDDALVSDGQGGYANLGEAVYAKDSGGRTEINELRNLVDNTDGTVHYKGTTTTALSNGSTTNPITIDGEEYTAVFGDIVVYNYTEFVFDGTTWSEFGRPFDTTPTSGSSNAVTSDGIKTALNTKPGRVGSADNSAQFGFHSSDTGAKAANSFATGEKTIANKVGLMAIGRFNVSRENDLFEIGNGGNSSTRSNILEVTRYDVNVNGEIKKNGVSLPTPYTTMPTITADMLGQIAQYVGETTNDYVKGYFYIASSDGAAEPTYSWVSMVDSTPTSGSKNFVTSGAVKTAVDAKPGKRGTGSGSVDMSFQGSATGKNTFSANKYTGASGENSASFNNWNIASQTDSFACGRFNAMRSGDLFNIGNGTANNARSNIVEANSTSINVNGDIQRDGVGIDDYTTTERKIGKWIDGSDLYQRTFEVTASRVDGWNDNILGTSGIKIVDVQGFMYGLYEDAHVSKPLVFYRGPTDFIALTYYSDVNVYIIDPGVSTSPMPTLTITIKYIKPSVQANLMQTAPTEKVSENPTVEEDDMR